MLIPPATEIGSATHPELEGCDVPAALAGAVRRRQLDYLAGRRAARRALIRLTGHASEVGRGADGAPVWPPGVTGAISHSDGRAVALIGDATRHAGLGIDLETIITRPGEIASSVLTASEIRRLPADALHLTIAFSAKESLFKALYPQVGRFFGFDAAEVILTERATGALRLCQPLGPWPAGAEFAFGWRVLNGQVLTVLAAPYARNVAPPST